MGQASNRAGSAIISQTTLTTAGSVLLTVVGIAYGGTFLKRVVTARFPGQ